MYIFDKWMDVFGFMYAYGLVKGLFIFEIHKPNTPPVDNPYMFIVSHK